MNRDVTGFHREDGTWFAELDCGHDVRVADGDERRVGSKLACRACDEPALPARVALTSVAHEWSEESMPAALRRPHRLHAGSWGRLRVDSGRIRFTAATSPPLDTVVEAGASQAIPPGVDHDLESLGPVRFVVELFAVRPWRDADGEVGGESSCFAHLLCEECGAVLDGGPHRAGCSRA